MERVCRPDSVHLGRCDGHSSGPTVTGRL